MTNDMYVPALRWRQGEYQALLRLRDAAKDRVVPFITIPEIEFDFEERRLKKTVHEHVHPFAGRYKGKWGKRPAWIAVHSTIVDKPMDDGRDVFTYVFEALRNFESNAIPAIPVTADSHVVRAVAEIFKQDTQGVGITLRLEDLMTSAPRALVLKLAATIGAKPSDVDLIVDVGAPNFEPYDAFAIALLASLRKLGELHAFRNIVLIATAIPKTFKNLAKGGDEVPRHDWMFYKTLKVRLPNGVRLPIFGDHTIVHPDFVPIDMRKVKSSGKVVYTTSNSWLVHKGGAFRDNPAQMHDHCARVVASASFRTAAFSDGDNYIAKCADRLEGASNQTRWKNVAINHHITQVLDDLATLGAAS